MKTTSRDIWAIPPGGFTAKPKRNWVRPTIAITLVLALGVGGGAIYASMKQSTAVSAQDAIAQFRAGAGSSDAEDSQAQAKSGSSNKGDQRSSKSAESQSDKGNQAAAAGSAPAGS